MPHSPGATLSRSQRYAACIRRPRSPLPLTLARRRQAETAEKGGFAEKYTQKILDNIQVTIQDIHIRYEDAVSSQRAAWVDDESVVWQGSEDLHLRLWDTRALQRPAASQALPGGARTTTASRLLIHPRFDTPAQVL